MYGPPLQLFIEGNRKMVEIGKGAITLQGIKQEIVKMLGEAVADKIGPINTCEVLSISHTKTSIFVKVRMPKEFQGTVFDGGILEIKFQSSLKLIGYE